MGALKLSKLNAPIIHMRCNAMQCNRYKKSSRGFRGFLPRGEKGFARNTMPTCICIVLHCMHVCVISYATRSRENMYRIPDSELPLVANHSRASPAPSLSLSFFSNQHKPPILIRDPLIQIHPVKPPPTPSIAQFRLKKISMFRKSKISRRSSEIPASSPLHGTISIRKDIIQIDCRSAVMAMRVAAFCYESRAAF